MGCARMAWILCWVEHRIPEDCTDDSGELYGLAMGETDARCLGVSLNREHCRSVPILSYYTCLWNQYCWVDTNSRLCRKELDIISRCRQRAVFSDRPSTPPQIAVTFLRSGLRCNKASTLRRASNSSAKHDKFEELSLKNIADDHSRLRLLPLIKLIACTRTSKPVVHFNFHFSYVIFFFSSKHFSLHNVRCVACLRRFLRMNGQLQSVYLAVFELLQADGDTGETARYHFDMVGLKQ